MGKSKERGQAAKAAVVSWLARYGMEALERRGGRGDWPWSVRIRLKDGGRYSKVELSYRTSPDKCFGLADVSSSGQTLDKAWDSVARNFSLAGSMRLWSSKRTPYGAVRESFRTVRIPVAGHCDTAEELALGFALTGEDCGG